MHLLIGIWGTILILFPIMCAIFPFLLIFCSLSPSPPVLPLVLSFLLCSPHNMSVIQVLDACTLIASLHHIIFASLIKIFHSVTLLGSHSVWLTVI